jgi:hypothetical protein
MAKDYALKNKKDFNAENLSLIAMDPKTGQILVMVGSRDYFDKAIDGNFNIATANRQPGSSFKPFIYATAFNKGFTPDTVLFDLPTEFQTTCDATGKAHRTSSVGQTDYDLLCQVLDSHGIKWINLTPSSNPPVKDRVNTVNARLRSASGDHFVTVNPTGCPELVKDLQRVSWKQNSSSLLLDQYTDHERTHASDAIGYVICQMLALESTSESRPGKLSVIVR